MVATVGAAMIALSVLLFIVNVARSLRRGLPAGDNPWGASTLEWATDSPPPAANFTLIPVVASAEPLWEPPGAPAHVIGLATHVREVVATTVLDAQPDHRYSSPSPSIWPFVAAVAVTIMFIGSIFSPWAVVWGTALSAIPLIAWFWPREHETAQHVALEKRP
jgi:cytochrome c oxidase subunit 1